MFKLLNYCNYSKLWNQPFYCWQMNISLTEITFRISKQYFLFGVFIFHHNWVLFCGFSHFKNFYETLNGHFNDFLLFLILFLFIQSLIPFFIMAHFSFAINHPEIFLLLLLLLFCSTKEWLVKFFCLFVLYRQLTWVFSVIVK